MFSYLPLLFNYSRSTMEFKLWVTDDKAFISIADNSDALNYCVWSIYFRF